MLSSPRASLREIERVGFIGLGDMGQPMAGHLIKAGYPLTVWARRPEAASELVAAGASRAASPAALAAECDVIITMVTADTDVRQVVLGPQGLQAGLRAGTVVIDMSTIAPSTARDMCKALAGQKVHFVDAPVSGGAVGAAAATLSIMIGGDAAVLEHVRPLLEKLGETLVHVGPSGAGQVAKACNQLVMVAAIQAAAEAMSLLSAAGVDKAAALQAMMGGSARSRVLEIFGGRMVRGDFTAGVQARLHHKDYAIILAEAHALGLFAPVTVLVWEQLNALMAQGYGRDDTSSLLRVLQQNSIEK